MAPKLNHIDEKNNPKMVDVSEKGVTHRLAIASCELKCDPLIFEQLSNGDIKTKKGPVFHTAIIAGTMAVKKTSDIIPFCHPLSVEACDFEIKTREDLQLIIIRCSVKISGKTGVEMEALTGATVAALTIYDMCKAITHNMIIKEAKLIEKSGGKRVIKEGKE
ncbi:MAG: cyclic pyranopterin monophosphate synthase MoaC [Halobacteriovoraceae bacterium]|nr:cyclic pyranopterin monophosphate synthase MoaC [Halobacteriovoraceae bacterium]|tara:strand:+ start:2090 stop:2578 length:489 start_codon:yes stop_codon:yes gene_type:complete